MNRKEAGHMPCFVDSLDDCALEALAADVAVLSAYLTCRVAERRAATVAQRCAATDRVWELSNILPPGFRPW